MAIGDVETLRFPMSFTRTTDDGTTPVIEAAATFTPTNYDVIDSHFEKVRETKEGLVEGVVIITAIRKT